MLFVVLEEYTIGTDVDDIVFRENIDTDQDCF